MAFADVLGDLFGGAARGFDFYLQTAAQERDRKKREEKEARDEADRDRQRRLDEFRVNSDLLESGAVDDEAGPLVNPITGKRYRLDYTRSLRGQQEANAEARKERERAALRELWAKALGGQGGDAQGAITQLMAMGESVGDPIVRRGYGIKPEVDPLLAENRALMAEQRRQQMEERQRRGRESLVTDASRMLERNQSPITAAAIRGLVRTLPSLQARANELGLKDDEFDLFAADAAQGAEERSRRALGQDYDPEDGPAYGRRPETDEEPAAAPARRPTDRPAAGQAVSSPSPEVERLRSQAKAAIASGKDPAAVRLRFKQLTGQNL